MIMEKDSKIYIAGHTGLVGSAFLRKLEDSGFHNLLFRTSSELNLLDQHAAEEFFLSEKPELVVLAAARVGGIHANIASPAPFLYENLQIQNNVIHSSWKAGVKNLLFFGASCMYPTTSPQPFNERSLFSGSLEPTNEAYALAKIAGAKLCTFYNKQYGTSYFCVIPTNLYGSCDNFHPDHAHLVPALIQKFHNAKIQHMPSVTLWGTGTPLRDFLYVDDLVDACLLLLLRDTRPEIINIGSGHDISVQKIANTVKDIIGFSGKFQWETSRPDGWKRKLLDHTLICSLGWKPKTSLREGVAKTYQWFLQSSQAAEY